MIEASVYLGGRGGGKTYAMLTEINELIVQGRRSEIVVVLKDPPALHWFTRVWYERFPTIEMPEYILITNRLKLRGKRLGKVFVENVELYEDGIYDERIVELFIGMTGALHDDPEIVFTSGWLELNQRSHSKQLTAREIAAEKVRKVIAQKRLTTEFGFAKQIATLLVESPDRSILDSFMEGKITAGEAVEAAYAIEEQTKGPRCRSCEGA